MHFFFFNAVLSSVWKGALFFSLQKQNLENSAISEFITEYLQNQQINYQTFPPTFKMLCILFTNVLQALIATPDS